jgi:hypothetical protein
LGRIGVRTVNGSDLASPFGANMVARRAVSGRRKTKVCFGPRLLGSARTRAAGDREEERGDIRMNPQVTKRWVDRQLVVQGVANPFRQHGKYPTYHLAPVMHPRYGAQPTQPTKDSRPRPYDDCKFRCSHTHPRHEVRQSHIQCGCASASGDPMTTAQCASADAPTHPDAPGTRRALGEAAASRERWWMRSRVPCRAMK